MGAWWLGGRNEIPDGTTEPQAKGVMGAQHAARGMGTVSGPAGLMPGETGLEATAVWLGKWSGRNGTISAENMTAAVMEALEDPDSVRGMRHFTHLLECLTAENAPAALTALKNHSGPAETALWVSLFCTAWGAKGGAAALDAVTAGNDREAAMLGWARSDPAAAAQWLAALTKDADDDTRHGLQRSLLRGMARSNPQAAIDHIAAITAGDRGDLIRAVTMERMSHGLPATAQWAAGLADTDMRASALEAVARHYMQVDPSSGMAWAAEKAVTSEMRQAVGRVADRIADKDVTAALNWTRQLPPGPGQEEAYQQVFSEWARKDPTASSQELLRMPQGQERDNAIHSFAGSVVRESPEDAIVWATAIGDPELRLDTQIDVARKWNEASPEAARTWMVANLPAEAREKALRKD